MSVPRSIAFLFFGLAAASAQEPVEAPAVPVVPPGVPVPGAAPAPAAGAPAANAPAALPDANLAATEITEPIEEPKLSGDALAALYGKYTGRRVIVSSAASTAEFRFIQDASPKNPLTYGEAAELLKIAATIENFVFVPDAQYPNLDILTLSTSGIRPTGRGVDVYNENSILPEGDAVISYVMSLNYIKPAEAVNTFTQIIGQFGAFGSIAPVPNAAAVVITENTSLIRKLIDLKKEIDKPSSQVGTRFIKVQYADVTEIATTLTELLTAQQTAQTTAGIQRADNNPAAPPGGVPGAAGGQSSGSGESTPVQIIPDPRTNRIFAMGRPVDLLFVEGLVREFDIETSEKNFLRRKLRFLTVSEFLPIAGDALTRAFSGTGDSGGASSQGGAQGGRTTQASNTGSSRQSGSSSRSGNTGSSTNFGGSFGGSSGGGGGGGGGGAGGALSDPTVSSAPESVLVGRTLLVADNITNSIVVQGPPSGLEIIERLLDQIDVKPDQVMISTVIGQLTLNDSKEFGVNYLFNDGDTAIGGGGGSGVTIPQVAGAISRFPEFDLSSVTGSGLRGIGTVGNLGVYLKALQSKTDFTVLSRPSIFTSNNQKGTISSGERIAIPTSNNNFSGGGSSTNIEYQDVVLKLEVIPLVNSDNEITMKIALLNDEQNGNQVIAGGGSNGDDLVVPRISTREILTTATVPNGQTIVLGGLIVGRNNQEKSGIPILSDIPYLGKLFSTTTNNKDRSELMVFIQPSIVSNDRSLYAVQTDMDSRYKVSEDTRTMADGPGVLPPVDAIPEQKGAAGNFTTSTTTFESTAPAGKKKPAFRPIHRR
ncbi:MAG: secretin N-terminal domain-containing protein [Akkermansiaceae bacterium]